MYIFIHKKIKNLIKIYFKINEHYDFNINYIDLLNKQLYNVIKKDY